MGHGLLEQVSAVSFFRMVVARKRERAADQIQEFDGKTRHASGLHGTREGGEERGMIQRDAIVQQHISEYGPEFGSDR